jgi:hypothetical protein
MDGVKESYSVRDKLDDLQPSLRARRRDSQGKRQQLLAPAFSGLGII